MSIEKKSKNERLKSAAIVKLKYTLMTGKVDDGFKTIFEGVLKDLSLLEKEVDQYIAKHQRELTKICLEDQIQKK